MWRRERLPRRNSKLGDSISEKLTVSYNTYYTSESHLICESRCSPSINHHIPSFRFYMLTSKLSSRSTSFSYDQYKGNLKGHMEKTISHQSFPHVLCLDHLSATKTGTAGLEPASDGLKARCMTVMLHTHSALLMCDKEAIEVQKILPFLSDTWPLCRIGRAVIRASQSCRQSCNKSQCPACGCRSHHSCTHAPQFSRSFPAREWGSVLQRQGACGQCP